MAVHNPKGPDRVKFIADLLGEGISQAEIGRRLGISRARVGQIVRANGLRSATRRVQGSLSERQVRVLKFIREFSNRNSYPPTYREIAGACDISISVVVDNIRTLEEKGYVSRVPDIARSIVLTNRGKAENIP